MPGTDGGDSVAAPHAPDPQAADAHAPDPQAADAHAPDAQAADPADAEGAADPDAAADPAEPAIPGVLFSSEEDQQYVTTEPTDIPDTEDFTRDAGAVSFWLEPGWESGDQNDADFIDLGDGGLRVVKNVNYLRFEYTDANGVENGVGVEISSWEIGQARQVTASWDGATISLFVDGKLVSQRANPGLKRNEDRGPVVLGSVYPPDRPVAPGVMTGVRLFNRPLDPHEVASIYATGNRRTR